MKKIIHTFATVDGVSIWYWEDEKLKIEFIKNHGCGYYFGEIKE